MPYKIKKVDGYKVFHGKKAMSKKSKSKKAAKKHLTALNINVMVKKRHPKLYRKIKRKR
ncbi:hypothetical protein ES705_19748 [subsurface metagenome]